MVDKQYDPVLRTRQAQLSQVVDPKNVIHNTLICTFGLKENEYKWTFDNVITLDDLFEIG